MSKLHTVVKPPRHRIAPKLIALVGNPNAGKTTVFNALTGRRHRVANFPGVTVESRSGTLRQKSGTPAIEVLDLPGAYSLNPRSADEAIVVQVLLGLVDGQRRPDLIVSVVDASNLHRHLFLATQLLEVGRPMIIALNMLDLAKRDGVEIDIAHLSAKLGVPIVPVIARTRWGIDRLTREIQAGLEQAAPTHAVDLPQSVEDEVSSLTETLADKLNGSASVARTLITQTLLSPDGFHERRLVEMLGTGICSVLHNSRSRIETGGVSLAEVEARTRYAWIESALDGAVHESKPARVRKTERADRILTHPVWGLLVLSILMGACFQSVYAWAAPVMDAIDGGFGALGHWLGAFLPDGPLRSLLVNGVIAGVGGVLTFLPQVLILFLFIGLIEDCGYLARAVFLLDRWMRMFGLSGKAVLPLLSSFACAVPAILSTRVIEERRDRFVTILIAPLMSCSARLPVYTLLIAVFVPATALFGGLVNLQAMTLLAMYLVGVVVAIPVAWLAKKTILKGDSQPLLIELPTYKWPSISTVFFRVYEQGREFCVSAGTMIFAVTILVWALGYYPRPSEIGAKYDAARQVAAAGLTENAHLLATTIPTAAGVADIESVPQLADLFAELDAAESTFEAAVDSEGLDEGAVEWLDRRRSTDAELARIAAAHGPAGDVTLRYFRAKRTTHAELERLDREESGEYLRQSWLGRMGSWIEPAVRPLGWDWRIGTAVIASFPAREVVIATMGTIYNLGSETEESSTSLRQAIASATWPDGRPVFNLAVALSIMVFFALCCQCAATLAAIKRETKSWGWPALTFGYMTGLAYVAALLTYQVGIRIL